ncbi:MAG: hypothetical protein JO340_03260 [Acidobacteriaceae bacterium]|nr:hypothetical protein [Acidobacteriaceae bacterium]
MRGIDRVFGWLLVLGGVGHGAGSYQAFKSAPGSLLWALSASFAMWMLAAINLLRAERRGDRALSAISLAGCLIWFAFVLWFGRILGNFFDFRVWVNLAIAGVLAIFSARSLARAA